MAKRYALVPENWLQPQPTTQEAINSPQPSVTVMEPARETRTDDIIELVPKRMRNKAKLLLHSLDGRLKLDSNQRVIYDGGRPGSHIIDLIRYFISPFPVERPIDAPQFEQLIERAGVPQSALANRADKKQWKRL